MDMLMNGPGGPGGISISGKWMNKRTGATIMVRDNIISDAGMQVICSDGSVISMKDFSREYIQASDELYDTSGNVIDTKPVTTNDILNQPLNTYMQQQTETSINYTDNVYEVQPNIEIPNNYKLIDKLFSKLNSKPDIKVTIEWADFPKQELKTLIDYLDVDKKDIADYVYTKFADSESVKLEIAQYLSSMLGE